MSTSLNTEATYRIERQFYDRIDTIDTGLTKDQVERRVDALNRANKFMVYRAVRVTK